MNAAAPVTSNPVLGIDAPQGVDLAALPRGYADHIRIVAPAVGMTNPALGIDLPAGARPEDLLPGVREYVHESESGP